MNTSQPKEYFRFVRRTVFTMAFVVIGALSVLAQERVALDTLLKRIYDTRYASIDSTSVVLQQLELIKEHGERGFITSQKNVLQARILSSRNRFDSARILLNASEAFFADNNQYEHSLHHGLVLLAQSRVSRAMGEHGIAKVAMKEALVIFERIGDKDNKAKTLAMLGNNAFISQAYAEALKYYSESQALRIESNLPPDAVIAVNSAAIYNELGQYRIAINAMQKSKHLDGVKNGPPWGFVNFYYILANSYIKLKVYDSALHYLEKSRAVAVALSDQQYLGIAEFRMAQFFSDIGDINRSGALLRKLLNSPYGKTIEYDYDAHLLVAKNHYASRQFDSCILVGSTMLRHLGRNKAIATGVQLASLVGNAYEKTNRRDSAIAYYQLSSALKDSIYGPARQKEMSSLFAEMETLTKQKEIKVLKKQSDLIRAENKILLMSIVFGTAVALLVVTLLVLNYRNRKRKHELKTFELQHQLKLRKNDLDQQMARIIYINNGMSQVEDKLRKLKLALPDHTQTIQQALNTIHMNRTMEKEWDHFDSYFGSVHVGFFENFNAKFPGLSIMERRLAGLVRMNLTNTEIAGILNIEGNSVKVAKHRLKKKLGLREEDDLNAFLNSIDRTSTTAQGEFVV